MTRDYALEREDAAKYQYIKSWKCRKEASKTRPRAREASPRKEGEANVKQRIDRR